MDPWFDIKYSWIPGTVLGTLCGLLGAISGTCAGKGIGRNIILNNLKIFDSISICFLVAGLVALAKGQPYGIWYGLTWGGFIPTLVLVPNYFVIRHAFTRAEMRKLDAMSLKSTSGE